MTLQGSQSSLHQGTVVSHAERALHSSRGASALCGVPCRVINVWRILANRNALSCVTVLRHRLLLINVSRCIMRIIGNKHIYINIITVDLRPEALEVLLMTGQ